MAMQARGSGITVKATAGKICCEGTKLSPVKGQLEPLRTVFEFGYAPASFAEQGQKHEGVRHHHEDGRLRAADPLKFTRGETLKKSVM